LSACDTHGYHRVATIHECIELARIPLNPFGWRSKGYLGTIPSSKPISFLKRCCDDIRPVQKLDRTAESDFSRRKIGRSRFDGSRNEIEFRLLFVEIGFGASDCSVPSHTVLDRLNRESEIDLGFEVFSIITLETSSGVHHPSDCTSNPVKRGAVPTRFNESGTKESET
jgi:hypothetical protein